MIIPTWNENPWLSRLLERIVHSNNISEIIVADNCSRDNTKTTAIKYGCIVITGGTPAVGRNQGAEHSTGDILVFCDADVIVPKKVWSQVRNTFLDEEVVAVHFWLVPISDNYVVKLMYMIMNIYFLILNLFGIDQGLANFLCVRKEVFQSIGGFDESIEASEDLDMIRKVGKKGRVVYRTTEKVFVSPRRFETENQLGFIIKCLFWATLRLFGSKKSFLSYRWEHHPHQLVVKENKWIKNNSNGIN